MAISGAVQKRLAEALVAAFPTEMGLRQLSTFALDHPLERITTASGLDARVFELLQWAASQGRIDLLVKGAYELTPTNPLLVAFVASLEAGWSFDLPEGKLDGGALPVGHEVRGWRVERRLGAGAMGTVYAVRQRNGAPHALKVLHAPVEGSLDDPRFKEELDAAIAVCGELNRGVASVLTGGVDVQLRRRWLVMGLVKGESLRARVRAGGRLSPDVALAVMKAVAEVLAEAHQHERVIVHCDLKPENVFIQTTKLGKLEVTVLDFGAARLGGAAEREGALGTPLYAAPEQWQEGAVTPAADVWALGLLAFYMLTGEDFWKGAYIDRLLVEQQRAVPTASARAAELGVALPESFDAWFARCVAQEPGARFAEAGAAYGALEPVITAWRERTTPLPRREVPRVDAVTAVPELVEAAVVERPARDAGTTLARWLAAHGTMAPAWVAWVLATVAEQLAVWRSIEGVHGTLEPDRIVLDLDAEQKIGGARVVDLEARAVRGSKSTQGRTATMRLSRTTLRYVSPRVLFEGAPHDDPWSMAMIAYEALTGRAFVEGLSPRERVQVPTAGARAAAQGASLPGWFEAWFAQCVREGGFEGAVTCGRAAWSVAQVTQGAVRTLAVGWDGQVLPEGVRRAEEKEHAGHKRYWCKGREVGEVLMVWVPPGEFWRGSEDGNDNEKPRHRCTLTKGFYAGVFPVTVEEYQRVVPGHSGQPRHPVANVSWNEAQAFCERTGFRLLTEVEWEYAARGSDGRTWPWGNEPPTPRHAWFGRALGAGPCDVGTHPAGTSPFGVQDLVGNVWEWCSSWYGSYAAQPAIDPVGAAQGSGRVMRGGSYVLVAGGVRAAYRGANAPGSRDDYLGFRLSRGQV